MFRQPRRGHDRHCCPACASLVTGGTSGLGLALVRELRDRGAHVALRRPHRDAVERTARACPGATASSAMSRGRKTSTRSPSRSLARLGGLDVLVNNASSLGPVPLVPLADTECEDLELALATNLLGPFRLTKALLGSLAASAREGRRPLVVNISSDAAVNAYPNWGAYGASKAGLHHLRRIWDDELADEGVRVVSVDPGDMDTPLHALAVPDADRSTLKDPQTAARELLELIGAPEAVAR